MRRTLLLLILTGLGVACGGRAGAADPAWPKSAGWDIPEDWKDDGGESIAPPSGHVAAVEKSDDATPEASDPPADGEVDIEVPAEPEGVTEPTPEELELYDFTEDETIIIEGELPPEANP